MNYSFNFIYRTDGRTVSSSNPSNNDFSLDIMKTENLITITVNPKKEIQFDKFELSFPYIFKGDERIFTNGYQSWTVTKEYSPTESMSEFNPRFLGIEKKKINPLGM